MISDKRACVCAVVADKTVEAARHSIQRAGGSADLIEVRLDYLRDFDFSKPEHLRPLLEGKPLPIIITCRAIEEGGKQRVDDRIRLRLLIEGARQLADYCDVEAAHFEQAATLSPDPSRLILSYHNFSETPPDLESIYDRLTALPAAIHKIATQARTVGDTLAIFRLLDRSLSERRTLIALAMGEPGIITRILGPSRGSFLTYGTLRPGGESAASQLSCEELRDVYRVGRISRDTAIAGIIGRPVSHSASPAMHNAAFGALGLDFVYLPIEVDNVDQFFARFVRAESREIDWDLRGFSVTIPHKVSVVNSLDRIDTTAEKVGAVNTVVVDDDQLVGYNTDVEGAIAPLKELHTLDGENVAVIGGGGAARAVVYGLRSSGARVTVFVRNPNACDFAERFGAGVEPLERFASSGAGVVINTTPVGMRGHSEGQSPVPAASLPNRRVAYDLVYNPLETRFLADARAEGCHTISGIEMLVAQATLQFELWTGHKPPMDVLRAAALDKLTPDSV